MTKARKCLRLGKKTEPEVPYKPPMYPGLTLAIKAKIRGLNAAAVTRCGIAESELGQAKRALDDEFGRYRWAFQKPGIHTPARSV